MFWVLLVVVEFISLFFSSQVITRVVSFWLFRQTRSQKQTIYTMAFLFFPGVVVHELAHFVMALVLFVKTGEIEFFPQMQEDHYVKLGSVAVAKSDPFRRLLIGIAPVIVGTGFLFVVFMYLSSFFPAFNWQTAVLIYVFFEIGNTMFSSKKDMEGAVALCIAVSILGIAIYLLGFRVQIDLAAFLNRPDVLFVVQRIALLLAIPLVINIGVIRVIKVFLRK